MLQGFLQKFNLRFLQAYLREFRRFCRGWLLEFLEGFNLEYPQRFFHEHLPGFLRWFLQKFYKNFYTVCSRDSSQNIFKYVVRCSSKNSEIQLGISEVLFSFRRFFRQWLLEFQEGFIWNTYKNSFINTFLVSYANYFINYLQILTWFDPGNLPRIFRIIQSDVLPRISQGILSKTRDFSTPEDMSFSFK